MKTLQQRRIKPHLLSSIRANDNINNSLSSSSSKKSCFDSMFKEISKMRKKIENKIRNGNQNEQDNQDEYGIKELDDYPRNIIISSKYTALNFIPKSLFEQFRRFVFEFKYY